MLETSSHEDSEVENGQQEQEPDPRGVLYEQITEEVNSSLDTDHSVEEVRRIFTTDVSHGYVGIENLDLDQLKRILDGGEAVDRFNERNNALDTFHAKERNAKRLAEELGGVVESDSELIKLMPESEAFADMEWLDLKRAVLMQKLTRYGVRPKTIQALRNVWLERLELEGVENEGYDYAIKYGRFEPEFGPNSEFEYKKSFHEQKLVHKPTGLDVHNLDVVIDYPNGSVRFAFNYVKPGREIGGDTYTLRGEEIRYDTLPKFKTYEKPTKVVLAEYEVPLRQEDMPPKFDNVDVFTRMHGNPIAGMEPILIVKSPEGGLNCVAAWNKGRKLWGSDNLPTRWKKQGYAEPKIDEEQLKMARYQGLNILDQTNTIDNK